jgi:hypothetical protein
MRIAGARHHQASSHKPWVWEHRAHIKGPPTESGGLIVKCIGVLPRLRAGAKGGQQADQVIKADGT